MRIHVIQHVSFEGPAHIAAWAGSRGHSVTTSFASEAARLSPDGFDMLVVMGGPMGVYDTQEYPWLIAEKDAIARAIGEGSIVLGVCLGAQLVADVLGAEVRRNPEPEIGWYPVTLTDAGKASRVFGSLPTEFVSGHWHGDTFDIPPGAARIASSAACVNQAFEYDDGRVVGLQFHLEWDRPALTTLVDRAREDLVPSSWVQAEDVLLASSAPFDSCQARMDLILDSLVEVHD